MIGGFVIMIWCHHYSNRIVLSLGFVERLLAIDIGGVSLFVLFLSLFHRQSRFHRRRSLVFFCFFLL